MGDYAPPFTITNKILTYVSSISEKIGRITATSSLESKPHLRRNNRIKSIHSSLKIEANSLSLGQVRDVIGGKTVLGKQTEIQEVKNAYEAYERLSEIDPYSIKDLKTFHGIMTRYLVNESGDFRHGEEGVFNGDQCIFMAPPAHLVPELMSDLFNWMNKSRNTIHPLILASVFHYEFVFIHPFSDGKWQNSKAMAHRYSRKMEAYNLNIFLSKARLRNSRLNIMTQSPNAIGQALPLALLNLCCHRLIKSWMTSRPKSMKKTICSQIMFRNYFL